MENQRLRELLVSRGMSPDEINAHVNGTTVGVMNVPSDHLHHKIGSPPVMMLQAHTVTTSMSRMSTEASPVASRVEKQGCTKPCKNDIPVSIATTAEVPTSQPNVLSYDPATETSCETAARILADFKGYSDPSQTRALLGCKDAGECHVKNTELFQLIDQDI